MVSAYSAVAPVLRGMAGFTAVEQIRVGRLADRVEAVQFTVDVPSRQLTRVAETLGHLDASVRRATALLDGRPLAWGGIPVVSPQLGGLTFTELSLASTHAKASPHGLTQTIGRAGKALVIVTLTAYWETSPTITSRPNARTRE